MKYILAIDPGTKYSAYALIDNDYRPIRCGKVENHEMIKIIKQEIVPVTSKDEVYTVIEMVASYGMAVGQTVFDTCVWIGMFYAISPFVSLMLRVNVKMNLCKMSKAKDANIKQALVDRFAKGIPNDGKGTKKDPGWFYGFKADIWQAYALAVTFKDLGVGCKDTYKLEGEYKNE